MVLCLTTFLALTPVPLRLTAEVPEHPTRPTYHLEIIPPLPFRQLRLRSRPSKKRESARMPLSSKSSMKLTAELLSHLPRSVLRSQKCSNCLHATYKYGKNSLDCFSFVALVTGGHRFQNKRQTSRRSNRQSTSAVFSSDLIPFPIMEGGPVPHSLSDYDANYWPSTDSIYPSDHPYDCSRFHAPRCHCQRNDFHHHYFSSLRHSPNRRYRRPPQAAGYNRWLGPRFFPYLA